MDRLEVSNVELLQGQANVFDNLFAFAESMALKSAVELRIADILHSHGKPMSLSTIASQINSSSSINITFLSRVMRLLVRNNIFTVVNNDQSSGEEEEAMYGLTPTSRWLIHDQELSLAPMVLLITEPSLINGWHELSVSIKEGGIPFERANRQPFWEKATVNPAFNEVFNSGVASATNIKLNGLLEGYKDGFSKIQGTLVDVGGGIGRALGEIVKAYPHINGVNFDLPHVIANAPQYPGVTHVGGDMFIDVPNADAIFLNAVLHNWGDEDCIKILQNCKKALNDKKGRIIIAEMVLLPQGNGLFDHNKVCSDLLMMALFGGGKERSDDEWNKLLKDAGFTRCNIITIPAVISIIEAHLD